MKNMPISNSGTNQGFLRKALSQGAAMWSLEVHYWETGLTATCMVPRAVGVSKMMEIAKLMGAENTKITS